MAFVAILGTILAYPADLAAEDMYPNKVQTHIGELTFDHGILTEAYFDKSWKLNDIEKVETP